MWRLDQPHALSISGWLNASPPHAHHQVHDHGESLYSAVYGQQSGRAGPRVSPFVAREWPAVYLTAVAWRLLP